jgi:hypothetical protein
VFSATPVGDASAYALAAKIRARFSQQSGLDAVDAAGLAVLDRGRIQGLPAVMDEGYESRSMQVVRIGYSEQLSEATTYIEKVEGTATVLTPSGTARTAPFKVP